MTSCRGQGDWVDDINAWWETSSPVPMVGSRHHTVPRFYLDWFSVKGRIHVRDRVTGDGGVRNVKDTGTIRDSRNRDHGESCPLRLDRLLYDAHKERVQTVSRWPRTRTHRRHRGPPGGLKNVQHRNEWDTGRSSSAMSGS